MLKSAMDPSPVKPRIPHPSLQVDEEVHFLLDNNNSCNYLPASTNVKTTELNNTKTYSKHYPIIPVKNPENTSGELEKKPKASNGEASKPKRMPRKSLPLKNNSSTVVKSLRPKSLVVKKEVEDSSDSDVEIVAIKVLKTVTTHFSKSPNLSASNTAANEAGPSKAVASTSKRKSEDISKPTASSHAVPNFNKSMMTSMKRVTEDKGSPNKKTKTFSSPAFRDLLLSKSDASPVIVTAQKAISDARHPINSLQWLSGKGNILVGQNQPTLTEAKEPLALPEMKQSFLATMSVVSKEGGKSKTKRELKSLYENLNEIKWTHQEKYKNMLQNPESPKKRRISVDKMSQSPSQEKKSPPSEVKKLPFKNLTKMGKKQKNKRELKSLFQNLNDIKWTHQKKYKNLLTNPTLDSNSVRPNQTGKALRKLEDKKEKVVNPSVEISPNSAQKKFALSKMSKKARAEQLANSVKKTSPKNNSLVSKVNVKSSAKNVAVIKQPVKKKKLAMDKIKNGSNKIKKENSPTLITLPKSKPSATKNQPEMPNIIEIKTEPSSETFESSKAKSKLKSSEPKIPKKAIIAKVKPCTFVKQNTSPPSTSACSSAASSASGSAASDVGILDSLASSSDLLHKYIDRNKDLYSAYQKGSKLKVKLQPLQEANLWSQEFYEDFRKFFLEQALQKALESQDQDSINSMFQELLETFMGGGGQLHSNKSGLKKKRSEEEAVRTSVRQSEGAFRYKEIVVRKHPNYMQVVLVPNDVKQNSLTLEALKELKDAFLLARKDPNCRAVLLNSSGTYFCTGIDLAPLVGANKRQAAEEISTAIRDLVMTLSMFTKPVVAAVNGTCMGFGISLLALCDVVLASDKATFCIPATRIGYIPEGGLTLTLPQVVGSAVASEMFLQGRRLTAHQAFQCGLVTEVLWPTRLMNEVAPRVQTIISQPLQAMEATKTMVRCHLWDKLKSHVDRERRLLIDHWLSAPCQNNIKALLRTGWLDD